MINETYGKWTVISRVPNPKGEHGRYWTVRCQCGTKKVLTTRCLTRAQKAGGGCSKCCPTTFQKTHGATKTPEYVVYSSMLDRCRNPNHPSFRRYGGRGIVVCPRWRASFANFIADVGPRPEGRYTLERVDNDKGYTPDNCVWATFPEQARNKCDTAFIEFRGERRCLADWADVTGFSPALIWQRLNVLGWTVEQALTTGVGEGRFSGHKKPRKNANTYTIDGVTKTLPEWGRELDIPYGTVKTRLYRGWGHVRAFLTPVRKP